MFSQFCYVAMETDHLINDLRWFNWGPHLKMKRTTCTTIMPSLMLLPTSAQFSKYSQQICWMNNAKLTL